MRLRDHNFRAENVLEPLGVRSLRNTPLLGVELELEFMGRASVPDSDFQYPDGHNPPPERGQTTDAIVEALGKDFAVVKRDGSLDDGVEIVTAPATFPVQVERWTRFFDAEVPNLCARKSCGMHVHVERAKVSDEMIGKMLYFLYHRDENGRGLNHAFISSLAGRSCNEFGELRAMDMSGVWREWKYSPAMRDRYSALNVTRTNTIEFRLFGASLRVERFMRRLEWVSAFVRWVRQLKNDPAEWTQDAFMEFVGTGAKRYPYLWQWLQERKRFVAHENGWDENNG